MGNPQVLLEVNLIWLLQSANSEATDYYVETIALALEKSGHKTKLVPPKESSLCVKYHAEKDDWFVTCNPIEACRIARLGVRNFILWCQGVIPEESYLRNKSGLRAFVLSLLERRALKKAAFCLFVSDEMRFHYEKKYKVDFKGRCFIMPCFNSTLSPELFWTEGKYDSPTFAYVGSLAAWQRFEETVSLYKAIESRVPGTRLKVLTFNQDEARDILYSKGVKNYEVGCVPKEKVSQELSDVSYGFVLREDNSVNRVATPTKLSAYMSAGVIPVFSDCLRSFANMASSLHYAVPVGEPVDIDLLVGRCTEQIDVKKILAEYQHVFETYYSRDYYVRQLAPLLDKLLTGGGKGV